MYLCVYVYTINAETESYIVAIIYISLSFE